MLRSTRSLIYLCLFLSSRSMAQKELPVKQEPRHHLVLENPYLRILDVHIRPKDTTFYHKHATASVIVVFTETRLSTQIFGEYPESGHTIPGSISYAAFDEKPVYHRVYNNDTTEFHVMDIELLKGDPGEPDPVFHEPDFLPAWQHNRVNAYTVYADSGQLIHKEPSQGPMLLICVTGSASLLTGKGEKPASLVTGSFAWIDPEKAFQLTGQSSPGAGFVLLNLHP